MSLQQPEDKKHTVHLAMGNGLREDVWEIFQKRFGPIRIWEFYGSTEGNMGLMNYGGRRGAAGKTNCFLRVSGRDSQCDGGPEAGGPKNLCQCSPPSIPDAESL